MDPVDITRIEPTTSGEFPTTGHQPDPPTEASAPSTSATTDFMDTLPPPEWPDADSPLADRLTGHEAAAPTADLQTLAIDSLAKVVFYVQAKPVTALLLATAAGAIVSRLFAPRSR